MLLLVDPDTLALNLALIIGALVVLGAGFIALVVGWTAVSSLIWYWQRRRAERAFFRKTRRADGVPYPARAEGICTRCGRGSHSIYFPESGDELCPECYETQWRETLRA